MSYLLNVDIEALLHQLALQDILLRARGELALNDEWPTVEHNGYVVKPLSTNDDMLFIQTAYLSPLEDMADYLPRGTCMPAPPVSPQSPA